MAIAGKTGKVQLGTNTPVTEIKNWSIDLGLDTLESTYLGQEWKEFVAGLKEWSASAEGNFNLVTDAAGQGALQEAYLGGNTVELKFYTDATHYYSGSAFISSMSVEDPVEDLVSVSFEFQGTGALTFN